MADFDKLFVNELDTPQTGCFEELYLRLDKQVERDLGHKQAWARAGGVPGLRYGCSWFSRDCVGSMFASALPKTSLKM
jgi:hypothetical protein